MFLKFLLLCDLPWCLTVKCECDAKVAKCIATSELADHISLVLRDMTGVNAVELLEPVKDLIFHSAPSLEFNAGLSWGILLLSPHPLSPPLSFMLMYFILICNTL